MAESGGLQPRSSKGTPAYKAGSSSPASSLSGVGYVRCLITARSVPAKEIGTGLCVFAQAHDEVLRRWGRAIHILGIILVCANKHTTPFDCFYFFS